MSANRIISIFFYVFAVFFGQAAGFLAFAKGPTFGDKYYVMACIGTPSVLMTLFGLLISKSEYWKRDLGIVLVVTACNITLFAAGILCMYYTPEFHDRFRDRDPRIQLLGDIPTGIVCIVLLASAGIALIVNSNKEAAGEGRVEK